MILLPALHAFSSSVGVICDFFYPPNTAKVMVPSVIKMQKIVTPSLQGTPSRAGIAEASGRDVSCPMERTL